MNRPHPARPAIRLAAIAGLALLAAAWADLDGDTVLCTPGSRTDLAGLAEVKPFPADEVSVVLDLTEPCRGPDWFFPRAGS